MRRFWTGWRWSDWRRGWGFSVAEVRELVAGFETEGIAPERWRTLAQRKLTEIDALILRAAGMRQLLTASLACGCLTLDVCDFVRQPRLGDDSEPGVASNRP